MHRTNRMKQSWSIHFPHQLMCRYQGLGCIPSWLDCIRSGKNYLGGKFVFISWFPALAVCRRIVIHMRDRSTWGRRVMPGMVPGVGRYLAYVREIITGTNTSVLLCSGTSHTSVSDQQLANQRGVWGASSQWEASKLHRALTSHPCSGDKDKLTATAPATLCFILKMWPDF